MWAQCSCDLASWTLLKRANPGHGHELAPRANAGDWILVEAWDDDEQEVWLAKAAAHFGQKCQRKTTASQKDRFPKKGVRFTKGECDSRAVL